MACANRLRNFSRFKQIISDLRRKKKLFLLSASLSLRILLSEHFVSRPTTMLLEIAHVPPMFTGGILQHVESHAALFPRDEMLLTWQGPTSSLLSSQKRISEESKYKDILDKDRAPALDLDDYFVTEAPMESLSRAVGDALPAIKIGFDAYGPALLRSSRLLDAASLGKQALDSTAPMAKQALDAAGPMALQAMDAAAPVAKQALDSAAPVAKQAIDAAAPVAKQALDSAAPVAKQALDSALPVAKQAFDAAAPMAVQYSRQAIDATAPLLKQGMSAASPVAKQAFDAASPVAREALDAAAPVAKQALDAAAPVISQGVATTAPAITKGMLYSTCRVSSGDEVRALEERAAELEARLARCEKRAQLANARVGELEEELRLERTRR